MSEEIVLTILVPFCAVAISLIAMAIISKVKRWRKRRTIERGVRDFLRRARN